MRTDRRRPPTDFGTANTAEASAAREREVASMATQLRLAPAASVPSQAGRANLATAETGTPAVLPEDAAGEAASAEAPERPAPIYLVALAISVLWALGPIAFAVGYRKHVAPLQYDPFAIVVFALLAVGPAVFVWGAAYVIRQAQLLSAEAARTKAMAEAMLAPTMIAAARAGDITQSVREEIARAGFAAEEARESLLALREALALESERLSEGAQQSVRTAQELAGELGHARETISDLSATLDAQATRIADTIGEKARMVAEAAEVADAQLREADTALAARAADLAAAASEASGAARNAGEDLVRHIARLETAGLGVAEQVRAVEGGLSDQRTALTTLSSALRADHEGFAQAAEAHAQTLSEFISQARLSAVEMSDRASKGGEALKQLMSEAAAHFRELSAVAGSERESFGESTKRSLEVVSEAAAEQRRQLEGQARAAIEALSQAADETREATARQAAAAREQIDQLSEAAFTAGQKANQVFEARLEEARALIANSSRMVEEAGAATARKLEEGAAAARSSLQELAAMLAEIEEKAQRLPASARAQSEEVRTTVLQGVEELMSAAHRTAEEAQAIDLAFQERVRRNFEMLSEAVRLMGTAAAVAPVSAPMAAPSAPAWRASPERAPTAQPAAAPDLALEDLMEPAAPGRADALAGALELRPRLRLTPTATDAEFSQVFEAAGGLPEGEVEAPESEAWTWKDLLASIDAEPDGERLEDVLSAELARLGVEPEKLLPKARIDEIAAAVQAGDHEGARQLVRRIAPAASRRISARLAGDERVRRDAQTFVRRYQTLIEDAGVRDPEGFLTAGMLAEQGGRLYLLLEAAAGETA